MSREDAESDIAEAANLVRGVLAAEVEPTWLWKRNEEELRAVAEQLELASSSLAFDRPYGDDDPGGAA